MQMITCDDAVVGQIKMGFNIIANAFKSKVKALEEDLRMGNEERTELEEKVMFWIFLLGRNALVVLVINCPLTCILDFSCSLQRCILSF